MVLSLAFSQFSPPTVFFHPSSRFQIFIEPFLTPHPLAPDTFSLFPCRADSMKRGDSLLSSSSFFGPQSDLHNHTNILQKHPQQEDLKCLLCLSLLLTQCSLPASSHDLQDSPLSSYPADSAGFSTASPPVTSKMFKPSCLDPSSLNASSLTRHHCSKQYV